MGVSGLWLVQLDFTGKLVKEEKRESSGRRISGGKS